MRRLLRRIVLHRTFLALLLVGGAWGGFTYYQWWYAPFRLDPPLYQAVQTQPVLSRVAVQLAFTPEDYHINKLQQYGIVAGVQGKQIFLVQVPNAELWKLAELYWIQRIALAP